MVAFALWKVLVAGCSEKACDSLSIDDARKILLFSSDKELFEYVKELLFLYLLLNSLLGFSLVLGNGEGKHK
ncbi:hypothetical protein CsSME_00050654 [Camellia sinensis var. sinensis]